MEQSEITNLTLPPEPQDTFTLPILEKNANGWEGKCKTFRVVHNVINIKYSDGNPNRVPSAEQRVRTVDDEGNFSHHVQLSENEEIFQLWMRKIGPYLGDWVLGKGRNGTFRSNPLHLVHILGLVLTKPVSPEWKLMKFPPGYTLWLHKSGVETDPANPRTDAYLHGALHLGPTVGRTNTHAPSPTLFRSPMEFVEHAIWLMRGGAGRCRCKYCEPGQNQLDINRRLNRGGTDDSDAESEQGEGGGEGSDVGRQSSSSSSRRRGAGAQARRVRRARRDRSPPIMAKDYRVGNDAAAAPPAGPA